MKSTVGYLALLLSLVARRAAAATPLAAHRGSGTNASAATISIADYGAVGDGTTDDTAAVQAAFDAALGSGDTTPATVLVPPGYYLLTSTVTVDVGGGQVGFQLSGYGQASNFLWGFDGDLFVFGSEGNGSPTGINVKDLAITSISGDKSSTSTAVKFPAGIAKSLISNVFMRGGDGDLTGLDAQIGLLGTGFDLGTVSDTTTLENCVLWFICGTGVKVGQGSEVRIIGGRIIGGAQNYHGYGDDNIGVHVTGNNGGVHLIATDVIALTEGLRADDSNGAGSNREIFLTHATLDSNFRGLAIYDGSYVSVAGCWASSSLSDNIYISPDAGDEMLLSVSGGTIYNAGVGGVDADNQGNGITANKGSFTLTGVEIRNNVGRGVFVPNGAVSEFAVTGSKVFSNGVGFDLSEAGGSYIISGNVIARNNAPSDFGSQNDDAQVTANVYRDG